MQKTELLKEDYELKKTKIRQRLNDFKRFHNENVSWFYENKKPILKKTNKSDDERYFEELCFCILTANTSAISGMKGIDSIRDVLTKGTRGQIRNNLKNSGYRFYNKRAEYIFTTREYLQRNKLELKKFIENSKSKEELRDFFATNKNIKGLSYKESSHFLRNLGFRGYGIIDKHILNSLCEFDYCANFKTPNNKEQYMKYEKLMKQFSDDLKIDFDEMDLLLWSRKTGEILK